MLVIVGIILVFSFYAYTGYRNHNTQSADARYKQALSKLEGKNFFCYNNKTDVQDAIYTVFIPQLSPEIEIIFLNGKIPASDHDSWIIRKILYGFKDYSKFPHLFKIRNGLVIELSINNEFFNMIDQNKPIADFFS